MSERAYPNVIVRKNVVNQSTRAGGVSVALIVIHDTEGANLPGIRDLQGLANFFDRPLVEASSHVATDAEGQSARFVWDYRKAWHCAGFNSASLGIEQIGFAAQQAWPDEQLKETARWVAYWSRRHGIPIQPGRVSGEHVVRRGVVTHKALGQFGGGHQDPGFAYPMSTMLQHALHYRRLQAR